MVTAPSEAITLACSFHESVESCCMVTAPSEAITLACCMFLAVTEAADTIAIAEFLCVESAHLLTDHL